MRRTVSANAAAQRRRRARLTEAQRQAEAERNAAQHRARRQREAVREAEAARQRERADDDRVRELHAERQRAFRAAQEEGTRQAELEANAARLRQRREEQEEAERQAELEANAARLRQRREEQEEAERQAELEANAARLRQRREEQEEAERQAELAEGARRHQQQRAAARARPASLAARRPAAVLSGEQVVEADNVGATVKVCASCGALRWAGERATFCCAGGKVHLDPLPAPPPVLRRLWTDDTLEARTFRQYVRHLNSALALSSLSVREVPPPAGTGGYAPCVVVQGRLYHRLGPLEVPEDRPPSFAQIYISDPLAEDPEAEAAIRLGHVRLPAATSAAVQHRLLDLLGQLQAMLRQVNPWVHDFIMAAEVLAQEVEHRQLIISVAARPAGEHARRYNAAEGLREVAVLMGEEPGLHDLVLRRRADGGTGVLQTIDESHRACDPLHFVLLFPLGTTGWHPAIAQAPQPGRERQRMVTTLQFYAYRLQIRPHQDDSLHRAGRLFQEFVCMAYAKVEAIRLKYISTHQREIRADLYQSVVVDVSALTRGVRLLSVEVPLTAVPAGPAASPAADIERGTCPPPFGPLQLLQSAAQLSVSRGLQRSGVPQLIQQLNEPPSPAAAEGAAPRRPGDVSTPGISGFCLADRQLHLLFAEGRADAELEQTAAAPRALPRRDARLCHHSGLLFRERLYPRQPAVFRVLEDRPLRAQLLDTRLYTLQKQEPARAVRAIRECFRTQWLVLYPDFPQKYRWDAGQKRWHRRRNMQAAPTIGRVVSLTPRHGDVFYLRVLLHHVPGATTFAELRTVDGQVCDTHQEACRRRGLLQDDQEWAETLAEAVRTQRPGQLRQLFVVVLLFCAPADPATLLHRFQAAMGEDFARRHPELPPETVTGLVLLRISDSLQRAGKTMEDFGLPPLGNGELPTDAEGRVTLPPALVLEAELPAVIDWTFGNLTDADSMASRAVLAPTNSTVDSVNSYVTDIFPGQALPNNKTDLKVVKFDRI
ncbi:hypothetical protein FJT64_016583 [Amphibalanus amphitrite]|uniref:Helitron helicase-like domain-containing protein n=1 Tax=Amphibalanus amphitrite TaxID=1232801 RepID=A0A6A4X399_AMPAM|nr:hypothetical protein FJT64_016583 [Amphibalanus amphitrite]